MAIRGQKNERGTTSEPPARPAPQQLGRAGNVRHPPRSQPQRRLETAGVRGVHLVFHVHLLRHGGVGCHIDIWFWLTLYSETAAMASRAVLGVRKACSFYRGICRRHHFHVPWSEGAKLDIFDITHRGVLLRLLDLFVSRTELH